MDRVTIEYRDAGLAIGSVGRVLVNLWRQSATRERLQTLRSVMSGFHRRAGNFGCMTVIEPSCFSGKPADVRAESSVIAKEFGPMTLAGAYIVEGSGFRVATGRLVISGVNLIARPPYPNKVFNTVEEGSRWLLPLLGAARGATDLEALVAATEETRSALIQPA